MGLTSETRDCHGRTSRGVRRARLRRGKIGFAAVLVLVTLLASPPSWASDPAPAGERAGTGPVSVSEAVSPPTHVAVVASPARVWTSNGGTARALVLATFTDSQGHAVSGVPVSWQANAGSLSAKTGTTNARGQVHVILTQPSQISPSLTAAVIATDRNKTTLRSFDTVTFLPNRISFLPMAKASGPWEWYGSCPFVPSAKIPPSASSGCKNSDPTFGTTVVNGDLWNLGAGAKGDVAMDVNSSGALEASTSFTSAPQRSHSTWVLGDPNISYGIQPQAAHESPSPSPSLPLPMQIGTLPKDVVATAGYTLSGTASERYDFAYDLWLEPQHAVETPRSGTIELMIWTADGNKALPPGHRGEVSMRYGINGVVQSGQWGLYITNGDKASNTQTTVYLVLTKPRNNAKVSVDFNSAIQAMETALKKYNPAHWSSFSNYYLDCIPLVSEFGTMQGKSSVGPAHWSLDDYHLRLGATLP